MQIAQRGERPVVEVAPVYEWRHQFAQLRHALTRQRAALDPGIALPFPALGVEVALQHLEARYQGTAVSIRSQAHVHAEHVAISGDLGQHRDQLAREPCEVLVVADPLGTARLAVVGVGENEIDIRRDVQFRAAQLAHAHDVQLLVLPAGGGWMTVTGGEIVMQPRQGVTDGGLGERRRRLHHFGERGDTAQVARHQIEHHALAQRAQNALEILFIARWSRLERRAHLCGAERAVDRGVE